MRTAEIACFTDDVASTRRFYEQLLGAPPEAEWPGGAAFAIGDVTLLVHERPLRTEPGWPPNEDHVAYGVEDLDRGCADLGARGLELVVAPRDFPWGRSAYLRDPDGRLVELTQA
jgi:catechol 2,3-dioxygenase-like lactoylglutathione lyase family enzyme